MIKATRETGRLGELLDRRAKGPLRAYHVLFWDFVDGVAMSFVVKVVTDDPGEALRMARNFHPHGRGFCFAQAEGVESQPPAPIQFRERRRQPREMSM